MTDAIFVVYRHVAPNGKSYIGQTLNLSKRNHGHQSKTGCRAFHAAINKYGWDNFTHEVLAEGLTLAEANTIEAEMISKYNTIAPHGYNLRSGGDNSRHSDETKALQRVAKLGRRHTPEAIEKIRANSRNQSAETRAKISKTNTGKKRDQETRERMAEAMRGLKRSPEGCANIRAAKQNISAETRAKISAAAKGRIVSDETRAKLSATRRGKKRTFTETGRANIVAAHKGKIVSAESRQKMSIAAKARKAREAAERDLSLKKAQA